jgi:hypothetical protein
MAVAAPPPRLALTGERSPCSHPVAEDGMRALRRVSAAGDIALVPRSSRLRGDNASRRVGGQARVVCPCT